MTGPRFTPLLFVVSVLLAAPLAFADSVQVSIGTATVMGRNELVMMQRPQAV